MRRSIHSTPYVLLRERLKAARVSAGLTQTDLSVMLGRPQSYVAKYESGDRRLDIVEFIEICGRLGVDIREIVDELADSVRG